MKHAALAVIVLALLIPATAGCRPRSRQIDVRTTTPHGRFLPDSPLVLHIREGRARYTALIGVRAKRGPAAGVSIHNTATNLVISEGWMYLFGQYPRGGTRLVNASATGTTIIVAHDGNRSRVIYLCAEKQERVHVDAQIPVVAGNSRRTLEEPWHYLDAFDEAGQLRFGEIKKIPDPGDPAGDPDGVWETLNEINAARKQAQLEGWCDPP